MKTHDVDEFPELSLMEGGPGDEIELGGRRLSESMTNVLSPAH